MDMDIEELVQQIARKVILELGVQEPRCSILLFSKRETGISPAIEKLLGGEERYLFYDDQYSIEAIDRFILPCLYIDSMVDLAIGKGGSKLMYCVRQVLLAGKKVEVAEFEYKQFLTTAPASLATLYQNYHDILKKFGIVELKEDKKPATVYLRGGLITEEHIKKAHRDSITFMEVADSCCITPLASDCAKEHSIVIKRVTGELR